MAEANFPADYLQINDLYRWSSQFKREIEYQPDIHLGKTKLQSRQAVEPELLDAKTEDGQPVKLLRAKVTLGIRVLYAEKDDAEPVVLHELEATFAVEYLVLRSLNEQQTSEFCEFNCVHNVWPFWRQYVYDTLKSASLPVISVPFFPGSGKKRKKRVRSKTKSAP